MQKHIVIYLYRKWQSISNENSYINIFTYAGRCQKVKENEIKAWVDFGAKKNKIMQMMNYQNGHKNACYEKSMHGLQYCLSPKCVTFNPIFHELFQVPLQNQNCFIRENICKITCSRISFM